jgi:hypothetical protein
MKKLKYLKLFEEMSDSMKSPKLTFCIEADSDKTRESYIYKVDGYVSVSWDVQNFPDSTEEQLIGEIQFEGLNLPAIKYVKITSEGLSFDSFDEVKFFYNSNVEVKLDDRAGVKNLFFNIGLTNHKIIGMTEDSKADLASFIKEIYPSASTTPDNVKIGFEEKPKYYLNIPVLGKDFELGQYKIPMDRMRDYEKENFQKLRLLFSSGGFRKD